MCVPSVLPDPVDDVRIVRTAWVFALVFVGSSAFATAHAHVDPARATQELAGHKDLTTTHRYLHLSPNAIESAIRLLESVGPLASGGDILETAARETRSR